MESNETTPLQELEHELTETEKAFKEAAEAEPFVGSCRRLRESSARLKAASEAADKARGEHARATGKTDSAQPAKGEDLISRARRAALGIPTLDDLRLVIFDRAGKGGVGDSEEFPELNLALQMSEEAETRARNEFYGDLDRFTERTKRLKRLASNYVEARQALAAARSGVSAEAVDPFDVEAEALGELVKLPALSGLEDYYVPR